ncbi:MAG: tyrosine-protein phosphatase [Halioglobus sp.]|nr:tyrosine-protein phosphatase [Halioglobus sp.]
MFDLSACHVERTPHEDYLVSWHSLHPGQLVSVFMTDDPEQYYSGGNRGLPVVETTSEQVVIANPDKHVRHYFYLLSEHGEGVVLAERQLPLEGAPNFRDLGGYVTEEGGRLKWGKLYRSSKLSELTDDDLGRVRRLGLTLVCDFRQAVEQELDPTHLGEDHTHILASLPVMPGSSQNFIENLHNGIIVVDNVSEFMVDMNRDFVHSQMPRYAEMFQLLLAGEQQVLIHCASGKDRTGIGSALILDVLGVPEDAIVDDYMLTNRYLPIDAEVSRLAGQFSDQTGAPVTEEVLRPLMEVRPEYILACFEEIRKHYASKEHFYETALDLDAAKIRGLRERYLH